MFKISVKFLDLAEKFAISIWGVTVLDLIPFIDLSFLKDVDMHLKGFVAIVGSIYFLIQIVFKTIDLNHKRIYNNNLRKIQENEIMMKEMDRDYKELRRDYYDSKKD